MNQEQPLLMRCHLRFPDQQPAASVAAAAAYQPVLRKRPPGLAQLCCRAGRALPRSQHLLMAADGLLAGPHCTMDVRHGATAAGLPWQCCQAALPVKGCVAGNTAGISTSVKSAGRHTLELENPCSPTARV
jgi:hypothetical protein